tara:strand:- start:455 stop:955 length:501 start_codon:yes stop_codon:yes gene_type:complete
VQISAGDGEAHLIQFDKNSDYNAPRLKALLSDRSVTKIYHYARFDVDVLERYIGAADGPIFCTKIASKLVRTFTDRHGLKELCRELLSIDLSKQQQSSYWGATELTEEQKKYAASDVLYLHAIKDKLESMLKREGRLELAHECFKFLPTRVRLDRYGWDEPDIFAH